MDILTGFGLGIIAALVPIYGWSRAHVRAMRAEALAEQRATLLQVREGTLAATELTVAAQRSTIARLEAQERKAREDAEWSRVMLTVAAAEAERHEERHACLPTLDGIRSERAESLASVRKMSADFGWRSPADFGWRS
jgi:hypothetical protein